MKGKGGGVKVQEVGGGALAAARASGRGNSSPFPDTNRCFFWKSLADLSKAEANERGERERG